MFTAQMSSYRPEPRLAGEITVVAEAAQGFEGDVTLARLLVRAAASAGADIVKFQLVRAGEIVTPDHRHFALFSALEMPDDAWREVADECRSNEIGLAFDVFGPRSLHIALGLAPEALKLHASDFFNHELVDAAALSAPRVMVSIGGIALHEVEQFLGHHAPHTARFTLMYGFQAEPTPTGDNHLARLATLRTRFPQVRLGFMDHADGTSDEATWLAALALPYGVSLVEKHLTIDGAGLEDCVSAAGPRAFRQCVARIRAAERALGSAAGDLTDAERAYRAKAIKTVVARRPLDAGRTLTAADVALLRPARVDGREPVVELGAAIGRRLRARVEQDHAIYVDDLA